jgi:alcohol dehydrogenase (NADP+)
LTTNLLQATDTSIRAPDGGNLPPINAFTLIASGIKVGGSAIGAPHEIQEMLQLAADQKIKPWIQERPLKDANKVVVDFEEGKARYRYVLVNEKHASKSS